jgi:2-dehydro-3-deoxygluconokinase
VTKRVTFQFFAGMLEERSNMPLAEAEAAFVDHRDIALALLRPAFADTPTRDIEMAAAAFGHFPRLQRIAFTRRITETAERHELTAHLIPRLGKPLALCLRV